MLDLYTAANNSVILVNPNTLVTIRKSAGYVINPANRKQEPQYTESYTGYANIQPIANEKLTHIEGMNLQGTYNYLHIKDQLFAAVRPFIKGGDLVEFDNTQWLVVKVDKRWKTWCKVLICLQSTLL